MYPNSVALFEPSLVFPDVVTTLTVLLKLGLTVAVPAMSLNSLIAWCPLNSPIIVSVPPPVFASKSELYKYPLGSGL